ncbi:BnaC02g22750D [Brassica napus]|uniref:BnaC02g22750D protein n=1 Tax=Brassica napus TaxID=3708 RepID=A0A078I055_BRANA|nr:BnaC02g22750D [Brassica napus]
MLKKRVVKDKETRIKFACLAITSSVLLPTFPQLSLGPSFIQPSHFKPHQEG